jgi:hypothetical protein
MSPFIVILNPFNPFIALQYRTLCGNCKPVDMPWNDSLHVYKLSIIVVIFALTLNIVKFSLMHWAFELNLLRCACALFSQIWTFWEKWGWIIGYYMTLYELRLFVVMVFDDDYTTVMLDFIHFLVYAFHIEGWPYSFLRITCCHNRDSFCISRTELSTVSLIIKNCQYNGNQSSEELSKRRPCQVGLRQWSPRWLYLRQWAVSITWM